VWEFAAFSQLRALAPHLPTSNPRLSSAAYEMVLSVFIQSDDVQDHATVRFTVLPLLR
jgi:hypothetical protein